MDGGNEQRIAIQFCFKAGPSLTEILVFVKKDYGNEAMNRSNIFRWYSQFRDIREQVEDDERGGRPKPTRLR
jgi:predicted patatin/cPLA2 family phospholipase